MAALAGLLVIGVILWEAFETVVLPRRVSRRLRLVTIQVRGLWRVWSAIALRITRARRRESFLSLYGPLSLILLLVTWAVGLIIGFALLHAGLGLAVNAPEEHPGFGTALYLSGTTLFTLGLGDVTPRSPIARAITVVEAGTGFAFLALVIGYLPVFYQAFSRREAEIAMLDEWAGSPPSAVGLLARIGQWNDFAALSPFLAQWERWAAELLESHISYPILAAFRSQHGNQSWVAALTTILDTCALLLVGIDGARPRAAWLTFAMARHAVVDLCQILGAPPRPPAIDRLPSADVPRLRQTLTGSAVGLREGAEADAQLLAYRQMYEPYVYALARRLLVPLPAWLPADGAKDNWQKTAWD